MDAQQGNTINDQRQSNLFNKLSPEIRSMIWKEVIQNGRHNDILHIVMEGNSLAHGVCSAPNGGYNTSSISRDERCTIFSGVYGIYGIYGIGHDDIHSLKSCKVFPLLFVFHRIHAEVIETFYAVSTFSLLGPATAHRFLSAISPHSRNKIRRLTITWMVRNSARPDDKKLGGRKLWEDTCKIIAAMPGLLSLHVALYDYYSSHLEAKALASLMECKAREFVVELPWHAKQGNDYVDAPFRVIRPKPGENKTYKPPFEDDDIYGWRPYD